MIGGALKRVADLTQAGFGMVGPDQLHANR
jgi:hypothetical protein